MFKHGVAPFLKLSILWPLTKQGLFSTLPASFLFRKLLTRTLWVLFLAKHVFMCTCCEITVITTSVHLSLRSLEHCSNIHIVPWELPGVSRCSRLGINPQKTQANAFLLSLKTHCPAKKTISDAIWALLPQRELYGSLNPHMQRGQENRQE